jgi:hypothetical protein
MALLVALILNVLTQDSPAPLATDHRLFEIVRSWRGEADEHLGIGISALGDVNEDGVADFIFGTMTGAYTFAFGPGAARVISGKDGSVLYTVHGMTKGDKCGDAFGDTIAPLGDLDRDGATDFAVGAWRFEGYLGYVTVYSGRSGSPLATIYGDGSIALLRAARSSTDCSRFGERFGVSGFGGSIFGLGDVDADGVPDFVAGGREGGTGWVVSGARFTKLASISGFVLGSIGDFDGDGSTDLGCWTGPWDIGKYEWSTNRGIVLGSASIDPTSWLGGVLGDVDGDGFDDLLVHSSIGAQTSVSILSGRSGDTLRHLLVAQARGTEYVRGGRLDDVDGDGTVDYYVRHTRWNSVHELWIYSGNGGRLLASEILKTPTFARSLVPIGDFDSDGRAEYLLSDFESQAGAECGGAVHLVRLRASLK